MVCANANVPLLLTNHVASTPEIIKTYPLCKENKLQRGEYFFFFTKSWARVWAGEDQQPRELITITMKVETEVVVDS